jgi:hypothetical protein
MHTYQEEAGPQTCVTVQSTEAYSFAVAVSDVHLRNPVRQREMYSRCATTRNVQAKVFVTAFSQCDVCARALEAHRWTGD